MKLSEILELAADGDRVVLRFVTALHMEEVRTGNWYSDRILEKNNSKVMSINYDALSHEWQIVLEREGVT
jgi:hypothetical protein